MKITRTVDIDGTIRYMNEYNEYHRTDGPAYESVGGYKSWCIKGKTHREDGPAIEYFNGDVSYYLDEIKFIKEDWEIERLKWLDHRGFPMSASKNYNIL
jgi:hypothetical protein